MTRTTRDFLFYGSLFGGALGALAAILVFTLSTNPERK